MSSKLAPLSGIAFLALVIGGGLYGGEPPSEQGLKSAKELAAAYASQGDRLVVAVGVMGLGLVFLVYFGSVLKTALDRGSAETGCLSRVAFAGVIVFVAGAATDFTLVISMVEAAKDKVDPVAIQALSAYFSNDFVPFAVGIILLTSASAISILKYGGAPKWLGWLAALITVVGLIPPIGFVAFPATGVWILLASIALTLQAGKVNAPPAM
ncbi:MAG TPA: hypothetical protein VMZ66_10565 [Aeromicrobium sp.]|nr:hypothetical protein [Aeromicrobium sp.]